MSGRRPYLMGDKVRLYVNEHDGVFREYAIVGAIKSRGLAVVMLAEFDKELAQVFVYPATNLIWNIEGEVWQGPLPVDRSPLVLPTL